MPRTALGPGPMSPLDRERIAQIEVGHTAVAPGLARALVVWFLLTLATLPALEWLGSRTTGTAGLSLAWEHAVRLPDAIATRLHALDGPVPNPGTWRRIVTANHAVLAALSAFETALEDHSSVGQILRPQTQLVLSGWLGAGNERVYAGRDRWLFYRPDVEYLTGRGFFDRRQIERRLAAANEFDTPPQPDPRPAIRQFARDLAARGIVLVVMPTPVKPTVHPEQLAHADGDGRRALVQNASFAALVDELQRDGLLVFDPALEIARTREASGGPLYLATDTHWRPETMQRVAAALAAFLGSHVELPTVAAPGSRTEPREARQTGDTAAMLDLPPGQTLYPPERVELRFVVDRKGDPWGSSHTADVLVLGDSFSNIYSLATMGWGEAAGFVEHLSHALQRPLDRIVQNDQGAHGSRALLARELRAGNHRLAGKRVVVWQFATRELAFGDWKVIDLPD